ncbi:hypothetical protein Bhyg_06518 [Pseudolycoriella hygida]|uniref:Uncharacterized protein n=1 Tax=Pseudolycoriella hygida TaxID=35572 RepID=A0A9Q0S2H8_9DIPT|nr:hypothetical protein Bhyg_06518 [Pseudolycoriella hygida]
MKQLADQKELTNHKAIQISSLRNFC